MVLTKGQKRWGKDIPSEKHFVTCCKVKTSLFLKVKTSDISSERSLWFAQYALERSSRSVLSFEISIDSGPLATHIIRIIRYRYFR